MVGKPERKRSLGRPRRRWDDSIEIDFQEVGRGSVDNERRIQNFGWETREKEK